MWLDLVDTAWKWRKRGRQRGAAIRLRTDLSTAPGVLSRPGERRRRWRW